jgi:hypothetical protein
MVLLIELSLGEPREGRKNKGEQGNNGHRHSKSANGRMKRNGRHFMIL